MKCNCKWKWIIVAAASVAAVVSAVVGFILYKNKNKDICFISDDNDGFADEPKEEIADNSSEETSDENVGEDGEN